MAIVAPIVSTFNDKGVRAAESAFGGLKTGLGKVFRGIAIGGAAAGVAGAAGIGKAIGAASDLGEAISATEQIYGDAAKDVIAFAENAAGSLGQSTQTVLEGAQTFGIFGKAAGLADDDLSKFATDFSVLASDLGSFYNEDPAAVIEALGAGLRGESEPLRRFGVLLNDAALKQAALELGIYDGNGALNDQQKILAAQQVIFAQTTDAQGDFARTSNGLANQQRILKARLDNVVAQLGRKFLPIATRLASFVLEKVVPAIERLVEIFDRDGLAGVLRFARDELAAAIPGIVDTIRGLAARLVDWIAPLIGPAVEQLGRWASALGEWLVTTGIPLFRDKAIQLGNALIDWITPLIGPALQKLGEWLAAFGSWLTEVGLPTLVDKAIQLGNALIDWITPLIGPAIEKLREWLTAFANWLLDVGLPTLVDQAKRLGDALVEWIKPMIGPTLERLGVWLAELGVWLITVAVPKLLALGAELLVAMVRWTVDLTVELVKGIVGAFNASADWMSSEGLTLIGEALDRLAAWIGEKLGEAATAARDFAVDIGRKIIDGIVSGIRAAAGRIGSALADVIPGGGKVTGVLKSVGVPFLASGGIVTSPTLGVIGEAGPEAVIPLDRLGSFAGSARQTIINISGALDPAAVADQIRQILQDDATVRGRLSVL